MIQIDGPALVSFSGGRTSGYMLHRILEVGLEPDVHVLFCNTGCEMPGTLDFVDDCARHWGVQIHWLEYALTDDLKPTFKEVNYETASRDRKPFEQYIDQIERNTAAKGEPMYLPGPGGRYCTTELKIRVMKRWMLASGYEHWTNVVGIRFDEPKRWRKVDRSVPSERWELDFPLVDTGTTKADVKAFWSKQPFDLHLAGDHEGNCDACHLKAAWKVARVFRDHPDRATWWLEQERRAGKPFRTRGHSIAQMVALSKLPILEIEDPSEQQCSVCVD